MAEKPEKNPRFVMTLRDLAALKWLAEQGVATIEQLWEAAWKTEESKSHRYAEERLRKMAVGGWVQSERVFGSGTANYRITPKGRKSVIESYPDLADFFPPAPKKINDFYYKHNMSLNWCRVYLQCPEIQRWQSDRAIRALFKKGKYSAESELGTAITKISPDALFYYHDQLWLLEYEGTQKNQTKYKEKAEKTARIDFYSSYYSGPKTEIQGILFIAATPGLKAILQKHFKEKRTFVFTIDELKAGAVRGLLEKTWALEVAKRKKEQEARDAARAELPGLCDEYNRLFKEKYQVADSELKEAEALLKREEEALDAYLKKVLKVPFQQEKLQKNIETARLAVSKARSTRSGLVSELNRRSDEIDDKKKIVG